ncbi:beta-ketoacyl synthase chain length factor [Piscinibacter defluvii]|uniref:beta-ketoacyl synthase chain length factor n=1 Tax=Piscinibacter defluvii TaxID=1796922 RepID=UPI000FDECD09|nr:beta-ketoacyl synthase chain length factor [Piscinibacter defluvii]
MSSLALYLDGLALWAPALPGWQAAREALRGGTLPAPAARPAGALLGANERRRAPESVLVALEVAQAAVAEAGLAADAVPSVFSSTHGDLAVVDALCRTLATDPLLLSPTRFHHSVHNAASGYWAIASGCRRPSSAVAEFGHAFAAGWLEAATQCLADTTPVLLVGVDSAACGPLASVNGSRGLLGVALVLAPQPGPASRWRVEGRLVPEAAPAPALRSAAAAALAANAMGDALPLFEALARELPARLALPLGPRLHLALALEPRAASGLSPAGA